MKRKGRKNLLIVLAVAMFAMVALNSLMECLQHRDARRLLAETREIATTAPTSLSESRKPTGRPKTSPTITVAGSITAAIR